MVRFLTNEFFVHMMHHHLRNLTFQVSVKVSQFIWKHEEILCNCLGPDLTVNLMVIITSHISINIILNSIFLAEDFTWGNEKSMGL